MLEDHSHSSHERVPGAKRAISCASFASNKADFETLKGLSVVRAKNGDNVPLVSVFQVCCKHSLYQA